MTSVVSYPCTLGDLYCISAWLRATGDAVGSPLSAADQLVSISHGLRQKEATVQHGTNAASLCVCGLWWVIIPFLDHVLSDLKERFADHNSAVYCLSTLIPALIHQYSFDDLLPALEMHDKFVDNQNKLRSEFDLWKQRWINSAEAESGPLRGGVRG